MGTAVFDTLAYAKKLKAVGVPDNQAEVQAEAIAEIINDRLVTKEDLERSLKELELRLIIKLGSLIAASIVIVAALVKLL